LLILKANTFIEDHAVLWY